MRTSSDYREVGLDERSIVLHHMYVIMDCPVSPVKGTRGIIDMRNQTRNNP